MDPHIFSAPTAREVLCTSLTSHLPPPLRAKQTAGLATRTLRCRWSRTASRWQRADEPRTSCWQGSRSSIAGERIASRGGAQAACDGTFAVCTYLWRMRHDFCSREVNEEVQKREACRLGIGQSLGLRPQAFISEHFVFFATYVRAASAKAHNTFSLMIATISALPRP